MTKKRKPGRPSLYKPEYGAMLIQHMSEGLSFEAFGGVVGVCARTLYDWEQAHPEFLQAKKTGESFSRLYWEKIGRDGLHNEVIKDGDGCTVTRSINATIWIFNMKNRFKWRDRIEDVDPDDKDDRPLAELSDSELMKRRGNGK
jgi:hypothetical protein